MASRGPLGRRLKVGMASLVMAAGLAIISSSPALAANQIRYQSSNANNVCTYGYNQNNQYTVRCLTLQSGTWGDVGWWWNGTVQILWSWYDHYMSTSNCEMTWWGYPWQNCPQFPV